MTSEADLTNQPHWWRYTSLRGNDYWVIDVTNYPSVTVGLVFKNGILVDVLRLNPKDDTLTYIREQFGKEI